MKYLQQKNLAAYRKQFTPVKCPILGVDMTHPVVDHNHDTGLVRGVIDRNSNQMEGKILRVWQRFGYESELTLPQALRRLANYLDRRFSEYNEGVIHPSGIRDRSRKFKRFTKDHQVEVLTGFYDGKEIAEAKNSAQRTLMYQKALRRVLWTPPQQEKE